MRFHILLALCLSVCQIQATPFFRFFNPIATLQADILRTIHQIECLMSVAVPIPAFLIKGNPNAVTSNKCAATPAKTTSSAAVKTSVSSLQSVALSKWSSLQSLLSTTTSLPPILTTSVTSISVSTTSKVQSTASTGKVTSGTAKEVSATTKPSSITSQKSSTAVSSSSTSKTVSSALAAGTPCAGNTPADRSKWCDYSTSTDYYNEVPNTGVTREVRIFQHVADIFLNL